MNEETTGPRHGPRRRSRRGLLALLLVAVLATCTTDRPTPTGPGGGGRGYLAIRPVLATPANLAGFGFTIDSLRVAAIRPPADTVVDMTVFFHPDSATIRLSLSVPLETSPETFFLLLQLRAGAQVLYSGLDTTQVSAGAPDTSSNASVFLKYVGPGAGLTSIRIAPRDSVVTLQDTKQFRVSADSNGKAISSFFVSWSTTDTLTAPIDTLGVLHAPAARSAVFVRAVTPDGVHDSTRVTFIPLPTALAAFSGGAQTAPVATRLPLPLRVQVTALDLQGVKGIPVRFQAVAGGGSVRDSVVITDGLGFAEDSATLGTVAGVVTYQASVTGLTPVPFTATATAGPISAAQSVVSVSAPSVVSGTAATLTMQAKDPFGNNLTSGGAIVAFTTSGGTSTGAIGATSDHGDGTYTATFTGILAGTATTLGATINGTAVTTTLPTLTVSAGAASAATSVVSVSSATVASGGSVTLTLLAKDAAGNALSAGGATVVFSRSGGTSTGAIGATTDHADGTYTATFTGALAGTGTTIGATLNGAAVTTALPTVTVTAGAISAATSLVTTSTATVTSGASLSITLQAKDAAGNSLTTGGATVVFSHSGGTSGGTIAPSPATDNGNGTYSATFIGTIAGTPSTIGATINGTAVTSTLPSVTVVAGAISAATSLVQVSAGTVASGASITLTLRAKDAAGNSLTSGGATVVFSNSGGASTGTIGATTDNGDGTYTALFTGAIAGTPTTIGATINGAAVTTALPTVSVGAGAISTGMSVVATTSATVAAGASATLTLQAKDAAGNTLTTGGATVAFVASGGTSTGTIGTTSDFGNGTYAATFTGVGAGTATTVRATINGSPTASTITITVVAGNSATAQSVVTVSAGTVASGGSVTLTLQARDSLANNVTTGGLTVVFGSSGGTSTGTIAPTPATDNGNGLYTATFTGVVAGTATTIGATMDAVPVTSTLPTVTVTPGTISAATSIVQTSAASVESGSGVTLTLQAKDAVGNNLVTGGSTVVFTASGGTSTGTIGPTADLGNGTYAATFTGVVAGAATTIGATIDGTPVTTALPIVTVTAGAASPATSIVAVSSGTVVSGAGATLTLQAKDAAGNAVTTGGASVLFNTSGGTSTGTITPSPATDNGDGTYTASFTGVLAGTALKLGATINGSAVTSTLPTVTVVPGAISTAASLVTVSAATVASGDSAALTLQAKDAAGNNLTTGGSVVAFSASGGAGVSTGTIAPTPAADSGNGTYTARFTAVLAGTATTIGATIGGTAVTSALPTITVAPGTISPATSIVTVSDSVVQLGSTDSLFLRAKDAAGNQLPTGGALVTFTQSTGAGVSAGTISATTDLNNGLYRAIFTGSFSGTPATIGATIGGVAVSSTPLPTIRVSVTTHSVDITADSTWTAAASPHIVTGYLRVRNGATLTIQPGAVVKFNAGTGLQVGDTGLSQSGALVLDGTAAPILLTANTASPAQGFWKGIEVQRSLPVAPWRRVTIEYAGGARAPFGGVATEACVLFVNRSGAALDLDSLHLRQCTHAGLHHFGGAAHVHRSAIDTVSGSGIHVDFDAQLELDSTTVRFAGQEGLLFGSTAARLVPSSGNQFRDNAVTGVHLKAVQLPGLLRQDSIVGNATNVIVVDGGQADPGVTAFTLFAQPQLAGSNGYLIQTGVLDIGRVGGQALTLDSNVVLRFNGQTGLVVGDSAGTRSGTIRSLATSPSNRAVLMAAGGAIPGAWVGVEIGRLSGADTLRFVRIANAGDSLPGRTVHRAGVWVRNPVAFPLVLDAVDLSGNGSSGAAANSGGLVVTANTGGVDVRNSTIAGNPGFGLVVPDSGFHVTGNQVTGNGIGVGAFVQGGSQITTTDSIAGNTIAANGHAVALTAAALRAFYDTVLPANTTDTLLLEGSFLTADARLPRVPGFVWHAAGPMTIDSNATFTIVPGNTVTFDTLAVLLGGKVPVFVKDLPAAPAAITVGGLRPGALAAPGTAAAPILLTSSVPGRGWAGIQWAFPHGTGDITNNVFTYVTVERAGYFAPCFNDCSPIPFSAIRITDSTDVILSFDHLVVRGSGAFGVDFERTGTGTLTVSNSQFYDNAGAIRAHSGHGNQLTITGSDLYSYGATVIDGTYGGLDSVNADGNWWGDVAGANPGFTSSDSLGRGSFGGTAVRATVFAGAPFFPVGPPARTIAARDTFLVADTVLSRVGQSDSLRVRLLDAAGRGVAGVPVSWTTTSGSVSPGSGSSDIGGRVATAWQTGSIAGAQRTTASGVGTPVVFPLDLLPGNTITTTVDWVMEPSLTAADSIHRHPGAGTDTVFYSSSNHKSAFVTHARDTYGNVTFPNFGPLFDQGPCAGFVCRFPAADSTKADTVFFRPPVIGDYVISGLYESGAGGSDQIVLRVNPVAAGVRIDRDVSTPGVQDTGSFTYNSQCRVGAPVNIYCARQFDAFVVDSGGAPILNSFASFNWITPAGDTTITLDSIRGPANDNAFVSAHADGSSYLVTFDMNDASPTFGKRDSMPIVVQQRPGNLIITPSTDTLVVGDSTVFTAAVTDQGGDTMPAVAVHWRADASFAGLTILDTAVAHQVKVRLDSAPFGEAHLTAVACCTIAQPPFDSLFGLAVVANPVQIAVSVGTSPGDVSVNLVTLKAYVGLGTDSVAVLDLKGDSLRKRISVPSPTYWTAVNTSTNRVYVGSNSSGTGYVIDGAADAVVGSFNVGASPFVAQMAVDEARNRLYVPMELCVGTPLCSNVRFLGVLDGATLALIDTVRIGHQGIGTAYDPTLNRIYVATSAGPTDTVKVIDATTLQVVDSIAVGGGVYAVAANPVTGKVYVTNSGDHTVSVIDGATNSVSATVSLGFSSPNDIAVDTIADLVYVAVSDNAFQFVFDGAGNTVRAILLDGYTTGVAVAPARGPVVFTQFNQNTAKILRF